MNALILALASIAATIYGREKLGFNQALGVRQLAPVEVEIPAQVQANLGVKDMGVQSPPIIPPGRIPEADDDIASGPLLPRMRIPVPQLLSAELVGELAHRQRVDPVAPGAGVAMSRIIIVGGVAIMVREFVLPQIARALKVSGQTASMVDFFESNLMDWMGHGSGGAPPAQNGGESAAGRFLQDLFNFRGSSNGIDSSELE